MPLNGTLEASCIYISLNSRAQEGSYHWGLIITDPEMRVVLHHASNRLGPWVYEEKSVDPEQSMTLVVLFLVSKIKSHSRTLGVIKGMPADGCPSKRTKEAFSCVTWAKDILVLLHECGEIVLSGTIDELEDKAVKEGLEHAGTAESGAGATVVGHR
ncbi:hypothetical protein E4U49_004954 [Claviceps purpurea]|nr:hypothetical protein E4U49_004954 [Claviceps purpurea]